MIAITVGHLYKTMGRWSSVSFKNKNIEPTRFIFDREIAQALAVLQVAIVSIDFMRFIYIYLDD